jgi:hypothetical protein
MKNNFTVRQVPNSAFARKLNEDVDLSRPNKS